MREHVVDEGGEEDSEMDDVGGFDHTGRFITMRSVRGVVNTGVASSIAATAE